MRLDELSLLDAAAGLRKKSFSEQEYLEALLSVAADREPLVNSFIRFDAESARERQRARSRSAESILDGIPFGVKDNIVTIGTTTTCASKNLDGFRSPYDATAVARLRCAGAYVFGKTNLDEFAMGSSTEHSAFGTARNPWNLECVPGGSSGGSAAAVAARMIPFALGSETGGSVRQPASLCGVVGMKPGYGRVSRYGLVAFASSLDQIGTMTRTVADCAAVLQVISGNDPLDSTSAAGPVPDYGASLETGVAGMRLGVVTEAVESMSGEVRTNFESALDVLRRCGAEIVNVSIPRLKYSIAIYYIVANAEASANLARFDGIRYGRRAKASNLRETYFASRGEGFGAEVKRRIMLGTFALSSGYYDAYYGRAQAIREILRRDFEAAFAKCDAMLTPTTPAPAFRIGEKIDDPLSMYLSDIFTAPANLTGIPAISIPSGFSASGLPLGLQIMTPHLTEERLLRVARAFERETNFAERSPAGLLEAKRGTL